MKIYFDGGCRPNPGPIETAVVVRGRLWHRADHGTGDNSDAEWLALIDAVTLAQTLAVPDVVLLGDSQMVVDQARGAARRVPTRFHGYLARFQALTARLPQWRVRHIGRAQNLAGIALDKGPPWPG